MRSIYLGLFWPILTQKPRLPTVVDNNAVIIASADGLQARQLNPVVPSENCVVVGWSPDGREIIAVIYAQQGQHFSLERLPVDGSAPVRGDLPSQNLGSFEGMAVVP